MKDIKKRKTTSQGFYIHPDKTVEFYSGDKPTVTVSQEHIGLIHNHMKTMKAGKFIREEDIDNGWQDSNNDLI